MGGGINLEIRLLTSPSICLSVSYQPETPTQYQLKNKFHTYHTTKTIFDTGANRFIRISSSRGDLPDSGQVLGRSGNRQKHFSAEWELTPQLQKTNPK